MLKACAMFFCVEKSELLFLKPKHFKYVKQITFNMLGCNFYLHLYLHASSILFCLLRHATCIQGTKCQ